MAATRIGKSRPRVLVIDDDEGVRTTLEILLQDAGINVLLAADGGRGLAIFQAHPVDLVITDMQMPVMNGCELIAEMRRKFPQVPIIAMSGGHPAARDDFPTTELNGGADRTIEKPFDYDALNALVSELLPNRRGASDGTATGREPIGRER